MQTNRREFLFWLASFGLGVFIWVGSMWQLEIITIWVSHGITHFEFPFFLEKLVGFQDGIPVYMGRDIMYGFNFLGYFIVYPISFIKLLQMVRVYLARRHLGDK